MTFTTFCSQRVLNINELREVLALMEQQESTDRYANTMMHINGNYKIRLQEDGSNYVRGYISYSEGKLYKCC